MKKLGFLGLVVLSLILNCQTAFSIQFDAIRITERQHEQGVANRIKVSGLMTCNMGSENTGGACQLKIKDKQSGQTFNLTQGGDENVAMQLYNQGLKNAVVEGKLSNADTIQVTGASGKI